MAASAATASSSSSAQEPPIIGFEDDKATVMNALLDPSHPELSVIVIKGGRGVGKTTLAKEIYTSVKVQEKFDVHIWLFEPDHAREELATQLKLGTGSDSGVQGDDRGWQYLKDKRYCLIIDNYREIFVRKEVRWRRTALAFAPHNGGYVKRTRRFYEWDTIISRALPDNKNGSRVLLVCRPDKYNKLQFGYHRRCRILMTHEVRLRSEEESLQIMMAGANLDLNLSELRSLLKLCGGLPWPLRFLGVLLSARPPNLPSWTDLLHIIEAKYTTSNSFVHLAMKYRDLKSHLERAAILSFLTFPPDTHIPSHTLFLMWISQRIAVDEEHARSILKDLIGRSIVRVKKRPSKCVVMEDPLIRALAIQEAKERRFARVIGRKDRYNNDEVVIYKDLFCPKFRIPKHQVKIGDGFSAQKIDVMQLADATCSIFNWGFQANTKLSWDVLEVDSSQSIREVQKALTEMANPRYLALRNSSLLPEISPELLDHLKMLVVEGAHLETLPYGLLHETMSLEHLILINTKLSEIPISIQNLKKLLTLNVTGAPINTLPISIQNLKMLRTLNVTGAPINSLPEFIGNLTMLETLKVRGAPIKSLPESLGQLKCLQTLDVRDTFIRSIPPSIWRIPVLRSVLASDRFQLLDGPPPFIDLKNLETLDIVNVLNKWKKYGLELPAVRKLGLQNFSNNNHSRIRKPEYHWASTFNLLRRLENLSSLKLQGSHIPPKIIHTGNIYGGKLKKLWVGGSQSMFSLRDISMPPHLTKITLENLEFEEDPMPMLGNLKNLKILRLRWLLLSAAPAAKKMSCSSNLFSELERLELYHLTGLEEWSVVEGAVPMLKHVLLRSCKELKNLPPALLQRAPPLQELYLHSMPSEFTLKFSHHPFVHIINNRNLW